MSNSTGGTSLKITALDLGAATGIAWGVAGEEPKLSTWKLTGATRGERANTLRRDLVRHMAIFGTDVLYIEEPARIAVMMDIGANAETVLALHGYTVIAESAAAELGRKSKLVGVQRVRKHFLGHAPKKGQGKDAVMRRCKLLGWTPLDNNQADAAAVFEFACAMERPSVYIRERLKQAVAAS